MRTLALAILALICAHPARAEQLSFASVVKASLVFRDDTTPASHYPHTLKVFLRLENVHSSGVTWIANAVSGIEAELLDADGKPVPRPFWTASIQSNPSAFCLPYGSGLDWLISHGGVSMVGDAADRYALVIGGRGWFVPIETAGSYTLCIRLRGHPWTSALSRERLGQPPLLLDLPPAKLRVTK